MTKATESKVEATPEAVNSKGVKYSKADQKKIKTLTDAGKPLLGDETSEQLDTLMAALEAGERDEDAGERVEAEGVPDKLPVRTELLKIGNKEVNFPIHFVAPVRGGYAIYNETGVRIDFNEDLSSLSRKVSRVNALRRAGRLPNEF